MIQQLIHRKSGLSYIPGPRYAAGMLDSRLALLQEPDVLKHYTRRGCDPARTPVFCGVQTKIAENKTMSFC